MSWDWLVDSVLHKEITQQTPQAIFEAVCVELARFFELKYGFSYQPKQKKLIWTQGDFLLEIRFQTSRSNVKSSFVLLEILHIVKFPPLKKWQKSMNLPANDVIFRFSVYNKTSGKYEKNFNLADFSIVRFVKIIQYIETKIILPFKNFTKLDKMLALVLAKGEAEWEIENSAILEAFLHFLLPKSLFKETKQILDLYGNKIDEHTKYLEWVELLEIATKYKR